MNQVKNKERKKNNNQLKTLKTDNIQYPNQRII